jgi:ATP-dependent protease HslVU (ClpYQ) peptidase subunit
MTLIVGVKCDKGVVLGADSAATYATPLNQQLTIRQETVTKLHISSNQIVIGVSGPMGLSQSYSAEVDAYIDSCGGQVKWRNIEDAKTALTNMMWKYAGPIWERASVVTKVVGLAAADDCTHSSAAAFAIEDVPHLVQFSPQCNAEEVAQALPFIALGNGQASADPFLAFIRRIFWPSELPSILDGELATVWTLDEVIRTTPGGVSGGVQVVVLKKNEDGIWKCTARSKEIIDGHRQMIADIERKMREATKPVLGPVTSIPPSP